MKFFINFLTLFFSHSILAMTPYFLISTLSLSRGNYIAAKLENDYGVNKEFIKIISKDCVSSNDYLAAQLCINKKGELKILSLNKKILIKSKEIFKRLK